MIHGRKRLSIAILGLATIVAVGLVPVGPTWADPDIDDVSARVDRLYHEAEVAQERYHDARLELTELRQDLASLEADQERQQDRLGLAQGQVEDSVVRQYEGENLSAVGQVVVSDDPSTFLAQLSTMSAFNDLQDSLFTDYATELKALDIRRQATEKRADEVAAVEAQMGKEKKAVDTRLAEAKGLLADLEDQEREEILSRSISSSERVPAAVPASGRAGVAVSTALAQVGDAYVYGAAGPSAFDCSGLTMFAWGAAGVGLPHSSSAQFGSGPRISASALQPGDLVFYYTPISHVGMYIGNGMIVHAANPGTGVAVAGLYSMPFVGAVRPG
ncbi:MAG: NlpC/P60 family protein [Nocardioides sp.]